MLDKKIFICLYFIKEQKDMINFKKLTKRNFSEVLKIKHALFPESNSDNDYIEYFQHKRQSNYYLILDNDIPCGIIGWYEFEENDPNAFVGWFGGLPKFRRKSIATKALLLIIDEVKSKGFQYLRVYKDKVVNRESCELYKKYFDLCEDYLADDKLGKTNQFVIYSKWLCDKKDHWNNRPLNEDDNYSF